MKEKVSSRKLIILAVILYFLNSTIFCFIIYPKLQRKMDLNFDGEGYQKMAINILSGKGFFLGESDDPILRNHGKPTLLRPPLYPYFISLVYYMFGYNQTLIVVIHILVNLLMIFIIYQIAVKVFDRKTAFLSSFVLSLYPPFIWYLSRLYNENLFNILLALSVLYAVKIFSDISLKNSIIFGLLSGLTSLCKGQMIVYPLVLLPGLIYVYQSDIAKVVKRFSLMLIFMLLVISPWTVRNYIVSGKFVLIQSGAAIHFMRGNALFEKNIGFSNPYHKNAMDEAFAKERKIIKQFESVNKRKITELELTEVFDNIVMEYIKNNPLRFIKKILTGCLQFWYLGESKVKSTGMAIIQFPLILFAIMGIYPVYKKRSKLIIPVYSLIIFFTVIHAALLAISRYSIPVMPYVIILASFGITNLYENLFFSKKSRSQEQELLNY